MFAKGQNKKNTHWCQLFTGSQQQVVRFSRRFHAPTHLSVFFFNLKKDSINKIRPRVSHVKLIRELTGVLRSPSVRHCWRALLLLSAGSSPRAAALRRRDAVSWRCESDKRIPAEAPTGAEATLAKWNKAVNETRAHTRRTHAHTHTGRSDSWASHSS